MNKFLASIVFVTVIGIVLCGGPGGTPPNEETTAAPPSTSCPEEDIRKCERRKGDYDYENCRCEFNRVCPNCNMGQQGKITYQEWKDLNVLETRANAPADGRCTGNRVKRIFDGSTYNPAEENMCCCEPENSPFFDTYDKGFERPT